MHQTSKERSDLFCPHFYPSLSFFLILRLPLLLSFLIIKHVKENCHYPFIQKVVTGFFQFKEHVTIVTCDRERERERDRNEEIRNTHSKRFHMI